MKHESSVVSLAAAAAAGAVFMYYLDSVSGARRRALARDKLAATGRSAAARARQQGKHAAGRLKGAVASGRVGGDPVSDEQLRDRIRSRLGHVVSHSRSMQVEVARGDVCLKGHVLAGELERVLATVRAMPGVKAVRSELVGHETAESMPHTAQHPIATGELQEHAHNAWTEQGL